MDVSALRAAGLSASCDQQEQVELWKEKEQQEELCKQEDQEEKEEEEEVLRGEIFVMRQYF